MAQRGVLAVMLGLLTTWIVAWGSGVLGGDEGGFTYGLTHGDQSSTVWVRDQPTTTFILIHDELTRHSPANAAELWRMPNLMPAVRGGVAELQQAIADGTTSKGARFSHEWVLLASGWPMRSACCLVSRAVRPSPRCTFVDGEAALAVGWYRGDTDEFPRFVAFRPLWLGMAANTALYATVMFVSLTGAAAVRRRWRRRRGRCTLCGYDLRGTASAVCPECGAPNSSDSND